MSGSKQKGWTWAPDPVEGQPAPPPTEVDVGTEAVQPYIGKHLLVGLTYKNASGEFLEQKQFHGPIVRVNAHEGLVIRLAGNDEEMRLPPDVDYLQPAAPGEYRLRSTGETVVDPDFVATWTVTRHDSK